MEKARDLLRNNINLENEIISEENLHKLELKRIKNEHILKLEQMNNNY